MLGQAFRKDSLDLTCEYTINYLQILCVLNLSAKAEATRYLVTQVLMYLSYDKLATQNIHPSLDHLHDNKCFYQSYRKEEKKNIDKERDFDRTRCLIKRDVLHKFSSMRNIPRKWDIRQSDWRETQLSDGQSMITSHISTLWYYMLPDLTLPFPTYKSALTRKR